MEWPKPWRALLFLSVASWAGCSQGGRQGDCESIRDAVLRENCRFEEVSRLYSNDRAAFRRALALIEPAASRDLLRLRLAIEDPSGAYQLCRDVETRAAQDKCRQVLGRPHLRSPARLPVDPARAEPALEGRGDGHSGRSGS